jgi:hypothetical protein
VYDAANLDSARHSMLDVQGLGTSDCKTELCTRHILANSSIDRRAQPQIAVERFAVLDFCRSLANLRLQSDAPRPCRQGL